MRNAKLRRKRINRRGLTKMGETMNELDPDVLCPYCHRPMTKGILQYFRRERTNKRRWHCDACGLNIWAWHDLLKPTKEND